MGDLLVPIVETNKPDQALCIKDLYAVVVDDDVIQMLIV